jgi:hypothetical protein
MDPCPPPRIRSPSSPDKNRVGKGWTLKTQVGRPTDAETTETGSNLLNTPTPHTHPKVSN